MMVITVEVNAPLGSAQAVKEALAMYLERFGDTRVIEIREEQAEQTSFLGRVECNGRKNTPKPVFWHRRS